MKKRKIGSLEVSVIGLGCNNFGTGFFGTDTDAAGARRIIDAALGGIVERLDAELGGDHHRIALLQAGLNQLELRTSAHFQRARHFRLGILIPHARECNRFTSPCKRAIYRKPPLT